jgi:arylsulfatase A-like enzyme
MPLQSRADTGPRRPNIVLIMSDDMGYSDIGCYGGEIETPNLDALAKGGVQFTQFYNTARCCPTRAALLTGLYSHQAGIGHMMEDKGLDGYRGDLNNRCVTIAEALRPTGYKNYMIGKWHVTKSGKPTSDADKYNWPLQRGFDRFYGTIHGAGSFFDPNTLTRQCIRLRARGSGVSAPRLLLHRCFERSGGAVRRRAQARCRKERWGREAVFHVRRLHGRALADARQAGRHRQVSRAL